MEKCDLITNNQKRRKTENYWVISVMNSTLKLLTTVYYQTNSGKFNRIQQTRINVLSWKAPSTEYYGMTTGETQYMNVKGVLRQGDSISRNYLIS